MDLEKNYQLWRKEKFNNKEGFFPVFADFKKEMRKLSPGAISLYIYFGLHSNNRTGTSFHSIGTIANYFGKSPRTITNWIRELTDAKLIERYQEKKGGKTITYLIPYGDEYL
ncbi:MAG: helix-turn-helix domain-containing protein [Ligilactobacillus animalis]|uniref:helix-turn-helix domain-containing protein n=1 Tax=Ligilactobacillus animalis TaxID=1605 RepID=UPI00242A5438|nr:helix-turn-helix domain-containing protein [Ligilactobacillus animalis]MCI5942727.1 helix-turn-helix domain-containing protein [Ligilactobacillus animalis]